MTNPTDPRIEAAFCAAWDEPCLLGDPIACHPLEDAVPAEGETQIDAMKAVIRRMVEAALKAADAAAWRPISEAPRDGTTILLYDDHLDRMEAGWTFEGDLWQPTGMPHKQSINHWMPLPPPPVMGGCDE